MTNARKRPSATAFRSATICNLFLRSPPVPAHRESLRCPAGRTGCSWHVLSKCCCLYAPDGQMKKTAKPSMLVPPLACSPFPSLGDIFICVSVLAPSAVQVRPPAEHRDTGHNRPSPSSSASVGHKQRQGRARRSFAYLLADEFIVDCQSATGFSITCFPLRFLLFSMLLFFALVSLALGHC